MAFRVSWDHDGVILLSPSCNTESNLNHNTLAYSFRLLPQKTGILRWVLLADFWLRYARYLEPKDVPAAKDAVRRGQLIHCKGISEMQLFAARFHERHGDISDARAAYGLVLGRLAPGLISAVQAAANFERRQVKSHVVLSHPAPDSTSSAPLTAVLALLYPMPLYSVVL